MKLSKAAFACEVVPVNETRDCHADSYFKGSEEIRKPMEIGPQPMKFEHRG